VCCIIVSCRERNNQLCIMSQARSYSLQREVQLRFLSPDDIPVIKRLCEEWFPNRVSVSLYVLSFFLSVSAKRRSRSSRYKWGSWVDPYIVTSDSLNTNIPNSTHNVKLDSYSDGKPTVL